MLRIVGTIGAPLVVAAAIATSATPAGAACQGPGWYSCDYPGSSSAGGSMMLPYIEQDALYRL